MSKRTTISISLPEEEKRVYEKLARLQNPNGKYAKLSGWILNILRDHVKGVSEFIEPSWLEKAKEHDMSVKEFLHYAISMLDFQPVPDDKQIKELKSEIERLRKETANLRMKLVRKPGEKVHELECLIYDYIVNANGRWVTERELREHFNPMTPDENDLFLIACHSTLEYIKMYEDPTRPEEMSMVCDIEYDPKHGFRRRQSQ